VHHASALRELSYRSLKIIRTLELPINTDDNTIDLPGDCVDVVALSRPGGILKPLPQNDLITPLRYHDTDGNFVPPPIPNLGKNETTIFGFTGMWTWFWNINEWGESTGRYFGAQGASNWNTYKVVKERQQIQLSPGLACGTMVLMYISDGQSVDNATQVDVLAIAAIQAYGDWKASPNAAIKDSPQARTFYNEERLLRASLSDLNNVDLIHIIRRQFTAAMKN